MNKTQNLPQSGKIIGNLPAHTPRQRQHYLRHPREVLEFSREVARAEADVVRRVLGLDALHVFDLPHH